MKFYSISFFILLFAAKQLSAQGIYPNTNFGINGKVNTPVLSSTLFNAGYCTVWDITPDQRIVVAGRVQPLQTGTLFCEYTSSGVLIKQFYYENPYEDSKSISAIKVTNDGRYLLASDNLMRFNQDGTIDQGFGISSADILQGLVVHDICITAENRIIVAGYGGSPIRWSLIGFDQQGNLDTSFAQQGYLQFFPEYQELYNRMIPQPDGKLLVSGCVVQPWWNNFSFYHTLYRLLPDGSPDISFGENGIVRDSIGYGGENYGLALQPDGKILVCGSYDTWSNPVRGGCIVRYLPNGLRDTTFGNNGVVILPMVTEATDLMVLPNGKILAHCNTSNQPPSLIQLLPNGMLDPFFANSGIYFAQNANYDLPMRLNSLGGNRLVTLRRLIGMGIQLQGYLIDLNVGVITPSNAVAMWVYPNPISESFEISFTLESPLELQFELFDLQGRRLQTLQNAVLFQPGTHALPLRIEGFVPAGNYVISIASGGRQLSAVTVLRN